MSSETSVDEERVEEDRSPYDGPRTRELGGPSYGNRQRIGAVFAYTLYSIFAGVGRLIRGLLSVRSSSEPENLKPQISSLFDRLELLHEEAMVMNLDGINQYLHQSYSELERAELALERKDIVSFWRYLAEAKKWELVAIERLYHQSTDDNEFGLNLLNLRAQDALLQAADVLDAQQRQTVEQGLSQRDQDGYYRNIVSAIHMIHQQRINVYLEKARAKFLETQLGFFITTITVCLALTFTIWGEVFQGVPAGLGSAAFLSLPFLFTIVLFGAMGAAVSSLLSLSKLLQRPNIPEQVGSVQLAFARIVLGAASALIIYIFVLAEIVNIFNISENTLLAIAFVSGFSERQLIKTLETFTGERGGQDRDQFFPNEWYNK